MVDASAKNVQARLTKKYGEIHFGFKLFSSVDRRRRLIRHTNVGKASRSNTLCFERELDTRKKCRDIFRTRAMSTAGARRNGRRISSARARFACHCRTAGPGATST